MRLNDLSPTTYFCFLMSEYLAFSSDARNMITSAAPFLNNILNGDMLGSLLNKSFPMKRHRLYDKNSN